MILKQFLNDIQNKKQQQPQDILNAIQNQK